MNNTIDKNADADRELKEQERTLNSYELKQEARRKRFEDAAVKAAGESDRAFVQADSLARAIPMGQPILVGHHSEGRHRRYLGKINSTFDKSVALHRKATHYAEKAQSVGRGGISSDDPDAADKLREQLVKLEQLQAQMKAANKVIKSKSTPEVKKAALVALGISEDPRLDRYRCGFQCYELTNNNANIRRIRQRIEQIEATRQREDVEIEGCGYTFREDVEDNRASFVFRGKPPEAVRSILKRHGFRWSPTRGAWVRPLTNGYDAQFVRQALDALSPSEQE